MRAFTVNKVGDDLRKRAEITGKGQKGDKKLGTQHHFSYYDPK